MAPDPMKIHATPKLSDGRMVLAFSGWMDGGDVSTGTVNWLVDVLNAEKAAEIDPEAFYIYNFPGSMEISALFRPHAEIEGGVVKTFEPPTNRFFCHEGSDLLLFSGKEPHLGWSQFAECIFSLASRLGVSTLYFVGSFGGLVPHTRAPRLIITVSDESLRPTVEQYGLAFADYEGPASFATYLMTRAADSNLRMISLVAEIPAYIEGTNPKCIEAVIRKLTAILGLQVNLDDLRTVSDAWEQRLNRVLKRKSDLAKHIRKLEEDYDNEVFDTQMGDLKQWLEQQGVRVD